MTARFDRIIREFLCIPEPELAQRLKAIEAWIEEEVEERLGQAVKLWMMRAPLQQAKREGFVEGAAWGRGDPSDAAKAEAIRRYPELIE